MAGARIRRHALGWVVGACAALALLAAPSAAPAADVPDVPPPWGTVRVARAGFLFDCVVDTAGAAWCWGFGDGGQLGNGATEPSDYPVRVVLPGEATDLQTFGSSACALLGDGAVWCWGENAYGQLGDGTTTNRPAPVRVPGIPAIDQLGRGGASHFCAIDRDGGAWCWGDNAYGELGTGERGQHPQPVAATVAGGPVASITMASTSTCVALAAGGVRCWGFGMWGQLGDGAAAISTNAVAPAGLADGQVADLAAGSNHACAIATGAVWCWGSNEQGGLGTGDRENRLEPVRVAGLPENPVALTIAATASSSASCARFGDGSAWCWGENTNGEAGDGTTDLALSPVRVRADGMAELSTGGDHTIALTGDGRLLRWGGTGNPAPEPLVFRGAPAAGSSRGGNVGAAPFRSPGPLTPEITTTIPTPLDISLAPPVVGANLLLAALAMLAFTVATETINRMLVDFEPLVTSVLGMVLRARARRREASAAVGRRLARTRHGNAIRVAAIAAFYGLAFAFLDPSWNPLSLAGAWLFGSFAIACGLVGMAGDLVAAARARRFGAAARVSVRPGSLLAAAASTMATRGLALVPGLMVGVPQSVELEEDRIPPAARAMLPVAGLAAVVGIGAGAWVLTVATAGVAAAAGVAGAIAAGLQAFLLLVFSVALQNGFVGLLAFRGSAGEAIRRRSRLAWAAALLAITFVFLHTLVNPRGDLARALASTNVQVFVATVVLVVVAGGLAWLASLVRRHRRPSSPSSPSSTSPVDPGRPAFPPPPLRS